LGVASIIPGRENSLEDLINKADKALYLAKHQGRNQTFIDHYTSRQNYFEV
jgi:PleD family two-component response regulator